MGCSASRIRHRNQAQKLIIVQGLIAKMMTNSHCESSLQLNFLACQSDRVEAEVQVKPDFFTSPWYADIIFVLQNLQPPAGLRKTQARSVKLKAAKFCIIEQYLFWKDLRGDTAELSSGKQSSTYGKGIS